MSSLSAASLPLPLPSRPDAAFLGIDNSVRGLKWVERLSPTRAYLGAAIAQRHALPEIIGRLLAARDVEVDEVPVLLNPTLRALCPDPASFAGMAEAADRIAHAILNREIIAIFGDYDVDGACAAALLHRFLAHHDINARIYIPDRMTEGYGPNVGAVEALAQAGVTLIVTVDCGSTGFEPLDRAASLGVDVVVADHHGVGDELPRCAALVNPNRRDCLSGQGHLCAAGVVFMLCIALKSNLAQRGAYKERAAPDLLDWLDLVALATICDVVLLIGVNRAFVVQGLRVLSNRSNPGLKALCDVAAVNKAPTAYTLGFILGPRINAGGRIGDSGLGARLLAGNDDAEAARIAQTLDRLNRERREIERLTVEEASGWADKALLDDPDCPIIIAGSTGWHKGLVGLVASRLTERCQRPALIFSQDDMAGDATGSARSIAGVDIGAAVRGAVAAGIAIKGGGHAMAAGITITGDRLGELSAYLRSAVAQAYRTASSAPILAVDGAIYPRQVTAEFAALLDRVGPYGQGNPAPRFCIPAARLTSYKEITGGHLRGRLTGQDGSSLDAVAFRAATTAVGVFLRENRDAAFHVAGRIQNDEWGGRTRIEFHIEDVAAVAR